MIFMMGLGIILRHGSFLPDYFFAFFYSGLGFALLVSGLRFIARFFRKNARQIIWTTIGIISVALGTLGIFIPLLPTVPLYLLGSTAFLSGSDLLYEIFKNSKLYKKILLPYIEAGGLTKRAKLGLILFVSFQIGVVTFFSHESILVVFIAGILYLGFLISMIFVVKTIQPIGKRKNREE